MRPARFNQRLQFSSQGETGNPQITKHTMEVLQVFGIYWSYFAIWNSLTVLYVGQTFSTDLFSLHTVGCSVNYSVVTENKARVSHCALSSTQWSRHYFFMPRRRTLVNTVSQWSPWDIEFLKNVKCCTFIWNWYSLTQSIYIDWTIWCFYKKWNLCKSHFNKDCNPPSPSLMKSDLCI